MYNLMLELGEEDSSLTIENIVSNKQLLPNEKIGLAAIIAIPDTPNYVPPTPTSTTIACTNEYNKDARNCKGTARRRGVYALGVMIFNRVLGTGMLIEVSVEYADCMTNAHNSLVDCLDGR